MTPLLAAVAVVLGATSVRRITVDSAARRLSVPHGGPRRVWRPALPGAERRARAGQLVAALDSVAASLRAGRSLVDAIDDASDVGPPVGPELADVARSARQGAPIAVALEAWADDGDESTRTVAAALAVGATVGGPVARAVDGAAQSLRERQALQKEAMALAAQARMSAVVLSLAPVAILLLLGLASPGSLSFFVTSGLGRACLLGGLALDALGAWWMQRLVRRAVDPRRQAEPA